MRSEKFERYQELVAERPGELNKWYAKEVGVTPGTISRWNKKLDKRSIEERIADEVRAKLEAEFEAKLRAVLDEHESERQEREHKKHKAEERAHVSRRAYFKRILDESETEIVSPAHDEDVTWQGFHYFLKGGQDNEVPSVIAGTWRQGQEARAQADALCRGYAEHHQYLGKI